VCNYQAPPPNCPSGYTQTTPTAWTGSSWVPPTCVPTAPEPPTVVAATGFWVWANCDSYNGGNLSGRLPVPVVQDSWSDGSVTYYQGTGGPQYKVLVDSQGNYYTAVLGDNWGTYDEFGHEIASLYAWGVDPSVPFPAQPLSQCSGSGGNHN
jgi:hypothetical protein